jgi:hypothetical protein
MHLKRIGVVMVLLVLLAAVVVFSPVSSASPGKKKCASFPSQKAAQGYFVGHGGSQSKDVSGLDPDGDGLVCPANPGPFAAYVELNFAKGFFYGQLVCVNYPTHKTKKEIKEVEERAAEHETAGCDSGYIEMNLKEVSPGEDPVVASHEAEEAPGSTLVPVGASAKNVKGAILSFEFKLVPRNTHGTFYALSEECFGTPSMKVRGG